MKFKEKLRNTWRNMVFSDKYRVFLMKSDVLHSRFTKFLLFKLKLKYLAAIWFYTKNPIINLLRWFTEIMINGLLIYVAVTSWLAPIHFLHQVLGYGLSIYIPTVLVKKMYNRISMERKAVNRISQPMGGLRR